MLTYVLKGKGSVNSPEIETRKFPKSNLILDVSIIFNIIHTEILSMGVEQCHRFKTKMYHVKLGQKWTGKLLVAQTNS